MFGEKKETFRKAALERLASPERLDEMMVITSPKGWIALMACGMLIILGVIWSIFGRIPERVFAQGMLIPGGSLLQVEANTQGMITKFFVNVGDEVEEGQKLAGINLSGQQFDLKLLQDQVVSLKKRDAELKVSEQSRYAADEAGNNAKRVSLAQDKETNQKALDTAQAELDRAKRLVTQGAAAPARVEQAELALSQARAKQEATQSAFADVEAQLKRLQTEILTAQSSRQREVEDLLREIEKKTKETEATEFIKSPFTGRITEISVREGATVTQQDVILRMERMDDELRALIYVPSKPGKKVEVGHIVQISPSTVKKEEFGSILAKVSDKRMQPATPAGMLKDLGNERLVEEYSTGGAPLRIEVTLDKDSTTFSGYHWTSGKGPGIAIFSGTPCSATIIVGEKRPIDYVIPVFKNLLSDG